MTIKKIKTYATKTSSVLDKIIYPLPYTTNLGLWLDGDDLSKITSSSGLVSQWSDKSGNNFHATQETDINKPSLVTDDISKRTCLRFINPDFMNITTSAWTNNTSHSLFYVMRYNGWSGQENYDPSFGIKTTGADRGAIHYIKSDSTGATYNYYPTHTAYDSITSRYHPGEVYLLEFHSNGSSYQTIKNGVVEGVGTISGTWGEMNGFLIGRQDIPLRYSNADYMEAVFYTSSLTESNRNIVRNYLAQKWKLNVRTPKDGLSSATAVDNPQDLKSILNYTRSTNYWVKIAGVPTYTFCDLETDSGVWMLAAYGANGKIGAKLNATNGVIPAAYRGTANSANLNAVNLVNSSTTMAISWNATGAAEGGISSYANAVSFPTPSNTMSLDASLNPSTANFQTNVSNSEKHSFNITILKGASGFSASDTWYTRKTSFAVNYGNSYGIVKMGATGTQLDWGPDAQTFGALYLSFVGQPSTQNGYATPSGTGSGYTPSTMSLWVKQ